jgi:predicted N-acyltransferase
MDHSCDVQPGIEDLNLPDWSSLAGPHDLFMDPRFVRVMEQEQSTTIKRWSAMVRDEQNHPAAIACLNLLPLDLAILSGGILKNVADTLRHLFPEALRYRALFCGLPVSAGQSHLRVSDEADVSKALVTLVAKMEALAREEKARFLIFKEFDDAESLRFTFLSELGFYRGESPPMNHFPARFSSFDEYRTALKAPYRSKIVRSERKFSQQNLRVECITDGHAILDRLSDETFLMYRAVVDKSPIKLEVLSPGWFREMASQFDRESVWTAVYDREHLLAWAYGLSDGNVYHSLFGGVDYSRNAETDAYFNLMYHELDFALHSGVADIQLGQTADDFKGRLGATQSRRWFFVKPLRWKAKLALNLASERLLPTFPAPTERHVFQTRLK